LLLLVVLLLAVDVARVATLLLEMPLLSDIGEPERRKSWCSKSEY
jgi:hypothetical protein